MRVGGLEPPRACAHQILSLARIPIPPHPQGDDYLFDALNADDEIRTRTPIAAVYSQPGSLF